MMRPLLILTGTSLAASIAAVGCANSVDSPTPRPDTAPELVAFNTYDASIGTLVEAYGQYFPERSEGVTMLHFRGSFDTVDGDSHAVDIAFETQRADNGTLRWDTFGPYRVPFAPNGNQVGTFYGSVTPEVVRRDDTMTAGEPLDISFTVRPSVLVHEFQPVVASCGAPVERALGGAAYKLRVEAIGFTPATFTYSLAAPSLEGFEPIVVRRVAEGPFDTLGENGGFVMPPVPDDALSYGAVLSIQATDVDGRLHASTFAIAVHRPLEFFYNGNVQVAEVLAPTPVSACIPGGEAGRNASYNESMSETRSRTYNLNWNESWLNSHTVASATSATVGLTATNGVGFATTDGEAFRWSVGGEVGGTIGLSKVVSLGVKLKGEVGGERSRQVNNSQTATEGLNESATTTDTESATESNSGSQGGSFAWSVSSQESIDRDFAGHVIAGTYGVFYRQALRLLRRGVVVTYNQCGAAEVVGEVDFTDWTWSPDLALGNGCPPLPRSNLPQAECIISPCSGE
ncbi:MAG: hypothetical protein AAGF12_25655 [Myxococcota bacterium]